MNVFKSIANPITAMVAGSFISFCFSFSAFGQQTLSRVTLISHGKSNAVIIVGHDHPNISMKAAKELQINLLKATSVTVPIITNANTRFPPKSVYIIIGAGEAARAHGVHEMSLATEAFRIKITPAYIVLVGHDTRASGNPAVTIHNSRATQWAVDYLLDRYVGVRWLWPGQLGTYIPKHNSISFPLMDITRRPALDMRNLLTRAQGATRFGTSHLLDKTSYEAIQKQLNLWKSRHELGSRTKLHFGAPFTHWWREYHVEHPDYFAQPIAGYYQPWPKPKLVKLRIGNPAVAAQIIANWKADGSPNYWDVCPNDGSGFDTSNASRKMDYPPIQSTRSIWFGKANLTIRYVKFWNSLLKAMKTINPDVKLSTYAYSPYRDLPKPISLEPGLNVEFVGGYKSNAVKQWMMWSRAGANLYLRPNWWWMGGPAPFIPLHEAGDYFKFAMAHGMRGFSFDRLMGYWGTQGIYYYLIARLSERPDLSVNDVINEYASAFGHAAPAIKEYISYWEKFSGEAGYPVPGGEPIYKHSNGLYAIAGKTHHISKSPAAGSWQIIPFLYTNKVLRKAGEILDYADVLAEHDNVDVKKRIAFLRSGLDFLRTARNFMLNNPHETVMGGMGQNSSFKDYMRRLTEQGVIWGDVALRQLNRFGTDFR